MTSGPGPRGEREGHVVALVSAASEGQWVVAEDREGARWEVECLGEPVEVAAQGEMTIHGETRPVTGAQEQEEHGASDRHGATFAAKARASQAGRG